MEKPKLSLLESLVIKVGELDFVEDAYLDDDCAYEGGLDIRITIKEDSVGEICKELGYNTEDW